jgi:hypothetical protein
MRKKMIQIRVGNMGKRIAIETMNEMMILDGIGRREGSKGVEWIYGTEW